MGHHIDHEGRFQSDKYPELGPDKIVVSFRHPEARAGLSTLADGYAAPGPRQDVELAADIRVRLASIGHCGKSEQPGGCALGDCNFPGSCECLCVPCRRARRGMCAAAPPLVRTAGVTVGDAAALSTTRALAVDWLIARRVLERRNAPLAAFNALTATLQALAEQIEATLTDEERARIEGVLGEVDGRAES